MSGGTAATASLPFRLGDPALCESRPLVTPYYYCKLGDVLCFFFVFVCLYCIAVFCVVFVGLLCSVFFLHYFDTVGWVF